MRYRASVLVSTVGLVVLGYAVAAGADARPRPVPEHARTDALADQGRTLYETGCVSCHGVDGKGVPGRGPDLTGAGAAGADFYLSTGRMPTNEGSGQARRKPPAYDRGQIDALVAYVASLGTGPAVPAVDPAAGDLVEGQQLYTANCAACHNAAGSGGALGQATYAPPLFPATATQVAEAIRVGPGPMPVFGPGSLDDRQVTSITRYTEYLRSPRDRGGLSLGRTGPVPEGLVAWLVGLGLVVLALRWIGTRT